MAAAQKNINLILKNELNQLIEEKKKLGEINNNKVSVVSFWPSQDDLNTVSNLNKKREENNKRILDIDKRIAEIKNKPKLIGFGG